MSPLLGESPRGGTMLLFNNLLEKAARVNASASLEERLQRWSEPPSKTEIEKCERVERMVKEAIAADPKLSKMDIKVFAKGSYANRTNIPSDSDVDVGVLHQGLYFNKYPEGMSDSDFNFSDADYSFKQFSSDVARAIQNKFGASEVIVDDKCIKVRSNSCRVDADVVPHFRHRLFNTNGTYREGVALKTTEGKVIYNWPVQDYDNGVSKNDRTGRGYKGLVRILKSIRSEMEESDIASSKFAKSFLISCLVYNVPDTYFSKDTHSEILSGALDYLIWMTADASRVKEWTEVNDVKYLFHSSQPWNLTNVNAFLIDAKNFMRTF